MCTRGLVLTDACEMVPPLPFSGQRAQNALQRLRLSGIISQRKGLAPRQLKQFPIAQRVGDVKTEVAGLPRTKEFTRSA